MDTYIQRLGVGQLIWSDSCRVICRLREPIQLRALVADGAHGGGDDQWVTADHYVEVILI